MFEKLLTLLEEPLAEGLEVNLKLEGGKVPFVDLNTMGKSYCHLRLEDGVVVAYRRYDQKDVVETYEELLDLVYDCVHGRSFFNKVWLDILSLIFN